MRPIVLLLFFLSGACGLVYEVVWTRLLTHVFGTTALAVGTVLAAFMSGLALGSWLVGRAADHGERPLRLYALLELGVGVTALAAHLLLLRLAPVYVGLYELLGRSTAVLGVARFSLAFVLVMAPTVLMGATLPVLARHVVRSLGRLGQDLSTLYSLNTLGAVGGTLATGFVLIGRLGLDGTVLVAVAGNLTIGAIALRMSARPAARLAAVSAAAGSGSGAESPPDEQQRRPTLTARTRRLLLAGLLLSGLTSFAYEILWTRSLVFLLGNSTYAVTTMLTAFLAGLALGGWLVRFALVRVRDGVALFGWIQVLIGMAAVAALPVLLGWMGPQALRISLEQAVPEAGRLTGLRFAIALAVMLVPATLIGTTFPLVGRLGVSRLDRAGRVIGAVLAVNTLGNVLGALLPALILLRWLGIQRSLQVLAAINVGVGLLVLAPRLLAAPRGRWALPPAAAAGVAALALAPLGLRLPTESQSPWDQVLYYREGPTATTTVLLDPEKGERSMSVDGIEIGGTRFTDFKQKLLAHLPKLLLDEVSPELSIGLGSGILAGESARHERVERLVCVEIEPSVVEGAALFERENHAILDDPRLELVVDDVADHLRTTTDRYAVVSADEKTAQDHASNGFSYSREYYELLRARLAPGGLVVQWVPTTLPPDQYTLVLRTFTDAFPQVLLFYFLPAFKEGAANTILVGSNEPLALDLAAMQRRLAASSGAFAGLAEYGLTAAAPVLAQLVADRDGIRAEVGEGPLNTLDRPRYEFYAPADYAVPRVQRLAVNHALLQRLRRRAAPGLLATATDAPEPAARLQRAFAAEQDYQAAFAAFLAGEPAAQVLPRYEQALAADPDNASLAARLGLHLWQAGSAAAGRGDYAAAATLMGRSLALDDGDALGHAIHGTVLALLGRDAEALAAAHRAVDLDPRLVAGRRVLADALQRAGRTGAAAEQLRALLALQPGDADARARLAQLETDAP